MFIYQCTGNGTNYTFKVKAHHLKINHVLLIAGVWLFMTRYFECVVFRTYVKPGFKSNSKCCPDHFSSVLRCEEPRARAHIIPYLTNNSPSCFYFRLTPFLWPWRDMSDETRGAMSAPHQAVQDSMIHRLQHGHYCRCRLRHSSVIKVRGKMGWIWRQNINKLILRTSAQIRPIQRVQLPLLLSAVRADSLQLQIIMNAWNTLCIQLSINKPVQL